MLALLAFTTIRTSSISTGIGPEASLSKTTPKQRQFSARDFSWTTPVLVQTAIRPLHYDYVDPEGFRVLPHFYFCGRYFSLPPPAA
jgi:hypothetical protein